MKIYGDNTSGNCLKIKYVADYLRLPYEWITVSALNGETGRDAFLARNPMGQIPAIELEDGRYLAQSNGIIRYLARGSHLLPDDAWAQAKIDEWLFWEQYSHEPYVAVCRFHMLYQSKPRDQREGWRVERGERALDFMDRHLKSRTWLAGDAISIADVALIAYTRVAHQGGFDLSSRPNVRNWITRTEQALGIQAL